MDIVVVRTDGSWYTRPDITLVRDADRFCLPDDCEGALARRARCLRIEKAGKALEEKFASRYFNSWAGGILLYGCTVDGTLTPYLDRATVVERTFHPVTELDPAELQRMTGHVVRISRHISYRIGDLIVFEQEPSVPLSRGGRFDNIDIL